MSSKNYLFISNSSKPAPENYESLQPIILNNYSIPYIEAALNLGYKVTVGVSRKYADKLSCSNYPSVAFYNAKIYRNPLLLVQVYKAYKSLLRILREKDIKVLHCNAPIGGVLGRICGKIKKVDTVIYTVHGLHFYNGLNIVKYYIFYLIEASLARLSDIIITINEEDFAAMSKISQSCKHLKVFKVHGVGIDTDVYDKMQVDRLKVRKSLGINDNEFLIITTGDINKNKNQRVIIEALSILNNKQVHFLICGTGNISKIKKLIRKRKLERNVHVLGFRDDIPSLLKSADLFVLSSYREGLPRSIMEAMAVGLPCVVSDIRGNRDLIDNGLGGILCDSRDSAQFADAIQYVYTNESCRKQYGIYNLEKIKQFDIKVVKKEIQAIYDTILQNGQTS